MKNKQEIIKIKISGCHDYYICSDGRVFNNKNGKYIKATLKPTGYLRVRIKEADGKIVLRPLHRVIAVAFIPNPNNKPQVNHINGIKTDNRIENLEWVTAKENVIHSINTGLRKVGIDNPMSKLTKQQVIDIRKMYKDGVTDYKLSEMYNIARSSIYRVVHKQTYKNVN